MKIKHAIPALLIPMLLSTATFAQSDDLKVFGYFQNNFTSYHVNMTDINFKLRANSFLMQQMNVFLQKDLTPEWSGFVNLALTNSYSSQDNIGSFKIEEAWAKYSPSSLLNIKGGVLIPRFNNFNEIKDRTVLLPYIYRPLAYESYFFDQFGMGEFVPTTANLQAYGDVPVGMANLNYAAFFGNSETSMLTNNTALFGVGQDPTNYKLYGARLGLEYSTLQLGVSTTLDRKNFSTYHLGYIPRVRLGTYLNYSIYQFEFEFEYIKVMYDLSQGDKDTLAALPPTPMHLPSGILLLPAPQNFDKTFWHVNLLYNIDNNLGVYAGYDYVKAPDNIFAMGGISQYNLGGCYRATDALILKAEYTHQVFKMADINGLRDDYLLGASVSF